jgi:hypothetical protein
MGIRRIVTAAGGALAVTGFTAHAILFQQYHAIRPTLPDPASGLIYASNSHGHYVYLSAAEATGLSLLMYLSLFGFGIAAIAIPKTFRMQPSAPYQPVGPVKWRLDTAQPATPLTATVFIGTAAITAALIYLAGPWIEDAIASSGIVLRFMS